MDYELRRFLDFLASNEDMDQKNVLIEKAEKLFNLIRDGNVYRTETFAVRFSYSKNGNFNNTVLSLSKLEKYDALPFLVVLIIANQNNRVFLANSTFLKKISHSSQKLSLNNIRGSFNGSDIYKTINDLENCPNNFAALIAIHLGLSWHDNLERLVEATGTIQSIKSRVELTEFEKTILFESPTRALTFINSTDYFLLKKDLEARCMEARNAIFIAKDIQNINLRGRFIETLVTTDSITRSKLCSMLMKGDLSAIRTSNEIGDYVRKFSKTTSYTDIKTKILYLGSNPKAYNIDKFLRLMGTDNTVLMFFFIGLDKEKITTQLCSVFHIELLQTSLFQVHWAGRSTRGVVQFSGNTLNNILCSPNFKNEVNIEEAQTYLQRLLER